MDPQEFQDEVIDRLARIETKQDFTNGRVNSLEKDVDAIKEANAEKRGANRLITAGSGLFGTAAGAVLEYLFRR